jgi:hypothetical protein
VLLDLLIIVLAMFLVFPLALLLMQGAGLIVLPLLYVAGPGLR